MAGISYPLGRFDLLLDMVHHRHRCDEDERRNDLVRVEAGVKEAPRDAHGGERLHHLEVARRRCARETKTLKINQERNST